MTFPKSYHLFASASYFVIILSISLLLLLPKITMADAAAQSCPPASESAVHIVYTEQPPENEEPEAYHIRTLSSVLGSEEAAKEALLYSYKTVASGFSAKLTPEQVLEMTNQPGVVQVVPSQKLQLHAGKGTRC